MRRDVATLGLVWLTAFNLRVLLFAIPPTLPAMRADLGLSYFATGSITSVAVLALGIASIPGALLATRFGARRLVTLCAAGLALFGASIALPPGAFWVFAGSALLTLSIAIAQPPLAVLIRRWFPTAIARVSNLYANGLLMGNVLGASLSPFISHAIGWRAMFLVWAGVAAVGAVLWVRFTPPDRGTAPPVDLGKVLRDPRVWQVAGLFTFQNLVYYTVATWVPFLLTGHSAADIATTYLFLTLFPIIPFFALTFVRWQYAMSTWFYVAAGALSVIGSLGLLLGLTDFVRPLVFMVGLGTAAAFVASIALPPLIATDESEASIYSAVMYTAGYLLAFVGPLTAGVLVDATGRIPPAFWPPVAGAVLMAVVGSLAPRFLARSRASNPA
ncbi:MAG TPA: MFS transporter [Candidatus Dormibacteraeota bacterium]|nr:MFS transporter [Candidatus Dormibacteraeota bacterium]